MRKGPVYLVCCLSVASSCMLISDTPSTFLCAAVLSSMQFTPYAPGYSSPYSSSCSTPKTLQIFSIKLAKLYSGLEFPLSVYGVVAVRDTVDHNRNLLFSCDRSEAQELTHDVCMLLS
jgi:hypothetical protein